MKVISDKLIWLFIAILALLVLVSVSEATTIFDSALRFDGSKTDSVSYIIMRKNASQDTFQKLDTLGNITFTPVTTIHFDTLNIWHREDTLFFIYDSNKDTIYITSDGTNFRFINNGGDFFFNQSIETDEDIFISNDAGILKDKGYQFRFESDGDDSVAYFSWHNLDTLWSDTISSQLTWTGVGGMKADSFIGYVVAQLDGDSLIVNFINVKDSALITIGNEVIVHTDNTTSALGLTVQFDSTTGNSDVQDTVLLVKGTAIKDGTQIPFQILNRAGASLFYVNGGGNGFFANTVNTVGTATIGTNIFAKEYRQKPNQDVIYGNTESDELTKFGTENQTVGLQISANGQPLADSASGLFLTNTTFRIKELIFTFTPTIWQCNDINISVPQVGTGNPPGIGSEDEFPTHDYDPGTDEEVYFTTCLTPSYKDGDSCKVEINWFVDVGSTADTNVVWGVEYKMVTEDSLFDFTNTTTVLDTTLVKSTNEEVHETVVYLNTTGFIIGGRVKCRIFRDADNGADNYKSDARATLYRFAFKKEKP